MSCTRPLHGAFIAVVSPLVSLIWRTNPTALYPHGSFSSCVEHRLVAPFVKRRYDSLLRTYLCVEDDVTSSPQHRHYRTQLAIYIRVREPHAKVDGKVDGPVHGLSFWATIHWEADYRHFTRPSLPVVGGIYKVSIQFINSYHSL